jgi:Carboxypeptidase regulatory-like domain
MKVGKIVSRGARYVAFLVFAGALINTLGRLQAQSLGNSGTVEGTVIDPSGAAVPDARITLHNPVSGYTQAVSSGANGAYRIGNIPPNSYHLTVSATGFTTFTQDVSIRSSLPIQVNAKLALSAAATTINVEAEGNDLLEVTPSAHVDADRNQLSSLPTFDPGAGLSQAITYSTGGVAADANGFFHPLGDHAQVTFVVDGQPISDQQSKVFSTQLPTSAIQSMQLTTGAPDAEFGDKSSLIDQVTTRSGLGAMRQFGSVETYYGSFGSVGADVSYGYGNEKVGNFLALDGARSGRFLDTPEFSAFHDKGNNETIFDRFDLQPTSADALHLNLFGARNWIQIPNDYDQLSQDQRQRVSTWNIAPGYQHTFNSHVLLTLNPYARKDVFHYYPSRDLLDDTPSTQSQDRSLFNYGLRGDLAISKGRHNIKLGLDIKQTRLNEQFGFGITDPTFNAVCNDASGNPVTTPDIINPNSCAPLGYTVNPSLQPGLIPFDLSRNGQLFEYNARHNINQYAFYGQDAITLGNFLLSLGLRGDMYYGLTSGSQPEPRAGLAYNIKKTNTVLRLAYSHTYETPFNENLLLSSAAGLTNGTAQAVLGAQSAAPIRPGIRNQYNAGFQQAVGKYILIDADYFWKYTRNAFDFSALQNTTITFPIAWYKSKLDGVTGRVSTTNIHGFTTYWTFGHTRARYFPGQSGGLLNTEAVPPGVFRIDHDQAFQSTVVSRYQINKNAEYVELTWRYDSGMVAGITDVSQALTLTAAQQATIGFACDGVQAMYYAPPIRTCNGIGTSTLLTLPQTGQENDDHNPDRIKPRNVFNLGIGTDNLLHTEGRRRITASLQVENLTNKIALYNFLSTFSGTHFLQPRTLIAKVGFVF